MSKWKCLNCNKTEHVVNGFCKVCGPTKTNPVDDAAKKEANVEGARKDLEEEEKRAAEAEARNQESKEAENTIDPKNL